MIMKKYIYAAEVTVKALGTLAVISMLIYGIICLEKWQRPKDLRGSIESVDTFKASV